MKYLEEMLPGDGIYINSEYFVVSADYKSNGDRMCVSLTTGFCRYLKSDAIVEPSPLYSLDKETNIIPIKPTAKVTTNGQ
jgi:hypothetical protein